MEISKTSLKNVDDVIGAELIARNDMRLAMLIVNKALNSYVSPGEIKDYELEEVLPEDVISGNKEVSNIVKACLDKIKAENAYNAIVEAINETVRTAQAAQKSAKIDSLYARDLAVWKIKRLLYKNGDQLPADIPNPED